VLSLSVNVGRNLETETKCEYCPFDHEISGETKVTSLAGYKPAGCSKHAALADSIWTLRYSGRSSRQLDTDCRLVVRFRVAYFVTLSLVYSNRAQVAKIIQKM
jgi:hypothetical protein